MAREMLFFLLELKVSLFVKLLFLVEARNGSMFGLGSLA